MKEKALKIIKTLIQHGFEACYVGGCVRDYVLGKEIKDFDVVTNATPEQVAEVFGNTVSCGNTFLVSLVDNIEVATYRLDKKDKAIHAKTLHEDVIRRDFTINGLAMTLNGEIVDYVGGLQDIHDRVLRFIGDPLKRIAEDPVRILRGLRFASKYNLNIEYNTHFAILNYKGLIHSIPKERVQLEIEKAFKDNAYGFIRLLDEYELLEDVFPAVARLKGIDGGTHHAETVFTHCLNALKAMDFPHIPFTVKLACLYHDTGKFNFQVDEYDNNTFHNHEASSYMFAVNDLEKLKFSNQVVEDVSNLCKVHMFSILDTEQTEQKNKVKAKRVKKLLATLNNNNLSVKDFLRVRYADKKANAKKYGVTFRFVRDLYRQILEIMNTAPPMTVKDLQLNGYDFMKLGLKGKQIGDMQKYLLEKVLNEEIKNEKSDLLLCVAQKMIED